ncbi:Ribosomal protein L11 methyltransferase [Syntrophobacter sp. SbD1]|nr:Ribosomal protein L11 methyltransferase [Syntrophobacter sp. SbD1]
METSSGNSLTKSWTRIDITCGAETADIIAAELGEAFGVSVEFISGGLRFYLDSARFAAEKERLDRIIDSAPALPGEGRIGVAFSEIPDEDWSKTWKEHFKPLKVGRRFLVTPTWLPAPPDCGRLVIMIDPGRAFGTGHHETTRLCLEWLETCQLKSSFTKEGESEPGSAGISLLDVGTGSGILAIGAALLGFAEIVGIDNDPEAIEVAKENVILNGLSEKIRVFCATPEEAGGPFDIVISNIESNPLIGMSETISSKVRDKGLLALSGILVEQADEVCAQYEKRGMRLAGRKTDGEWVLLSFRK